LSWGIGLGFVERLGQKTEENILVRFDGQIHPDLPGRYGDRKKTSPGNLRDNLMISNKIWYLYIYIYCISFSPPRQHIGFMVDVADL
jgi:hypothetical protein